eukprot:2027370-Pleurochrysis_carterae.AAC.1
MKRSCGGAKKSKVTHLKAISPDVHLKARSHIATRQPLLMLSAELIRTSKRAKKNCAPGRDRSSH